MCGPLHQSPSIVCISRARPFVSSIRTARSGSRGLRAPLGVLPCAVAPTKGMGRCIDDIANHGNTVPWSNAGGDYVHSTGASLRCFSQWEPSRCAWLSFGDFFPGSIRTVRAPRLDVHRYSVCPDILFRSCFYALCPFFLNLSSGVICLGIR